MPTGSSRAAVLSTAGRRSEPAGFYGRGLWPAPVVTAAASDDDLDMSLIDKSPGAFIAAVNAILYATVLLETWMLTTSSLAVMGLFMALIIVLAGMLCRYIMDLMGTEEYISGEQPVALAVAAPVAAPVATVRPAAPAGVGFPALS
jgi:hypothetical protein